VAEARNAARRRGLEVALLVLLLLLLAVVVAREEVAKVAVRVRTVFLPHSSWEDARRVGASERRSMAGY